MQKSNEASEENIEKSAKSESNFPPTLVDHHLLSHMTFNGHYLVKNSISIPKRVTNLYISYEITQ